MKKRLISTILLVVMLASAACGSETASNDSTTANTTTAPGESGYIYPELDCKGETFTILNSTTTWGFYTDIHFDEATGDTLDDTVYAANMKVEDAFNVKLEVVDENVEKCTDKLIASILAGDDDYQAALTKADAVSKLILENGVQDLTKYPALQLDEAWWDADVRSAAGIGKSGAVYFAANDISLMGFEGTMCTYMNEDMIARLNLEPLYDTVREGKWTFDVMQEYMRAAANLNGDESYAFSETGNADYGLSTWSGTITALIYASGQQLVKIRDGEPALIVENEEFYDVTDRIAKMFGTEGETVFGNSSGTAKHYEQMFKDGRSMFTIAQLKASSKYRDMEDNFGIVPMPKYDESQEAYYCTRSTNIPVTTIPVTNKDPDRAAAIIDAMAYHAYYDVLPVYYTVNVEQKQLRNEDSIEMLELIGQSCVMDIGMIYGWTYSMTEPIISKLLVGDNSVTSVVASTKEGVLAKIAETMEMLNQ